MQPSQLRTKQARSAETQRNLLEATIECIVEQGLAKVTTGEVAHRAGTSQGAVFKHFPTKAALVSAAVERLYDQLIEVYREALAHMAPDSDLVDSCVDTLWVLFQTPRLLAVYDLHIAARTDPVLREVVGPMERAHRAKIRELAGLIFPDARAKPHFVGGIEVIINSVQGAAVGSMALREPEVAAEMIVAIKLLARRFLEVNND